MVGAPGAWSKSVVPILLMSHEYVLGVKCNKPIRVSSPIPFKSQLHSRYGGFAIYMVEFASGKTEVKACKQTINRKSWIPPKHFYLYAHNNNLLQ